MIPDEWESYKISLVDLDDNIESVRSLVEKEFIDILLVSLYICVYS
jgi:hypothetical protein